VAGEVLEVDEVGEDAEEGEVEWDTVKDGQEDLKSDDDLIGKSAVRANAEA
jgi:hypothetical protein